MLFLGHSVIMLSCPGSDIWTISGEDNVAKDVLMIMKAGEDKILISILKISRRKLISNPGCHIT